MGTLVLERPTTPERSYAQRLEALDRANYVRTWRAQMKRDVRAGRTTIPVLLASPPWALESMPVLDLLLLMRSVGRVKAMKLLRAAGVAPSRSVGALSPRQRAELLALLGRPPGR